MPEPTEQPAAASAPTLRDVGIALGLLALTAVVFWPVGRWLATQTFAHEQLKQSFFITVLAGLWISWEQRAKLRPVLELSNGALLWLMVSYALAIYALVLKAPLLVLAGLFAAIGGAVNFLLGGKAFRHALPLLGASALLICFVLLFPVLDWPLRQMAGVESARLLKAVGLASQLAVSVQPPFQLLLLTNARVFEVATECNGFGLITSSLLLGTILLLYRRAAWWKLLLLPPLCVAVGFAFNLLRIFVIVVLAPKFPNHYHALHETAGFAALYSGLGLVWFLTGWRGKKRRTA